MEITRQRDRALVELSEVAESISVTSQVPDSPGESRRVNPDFVHAIEMVDDELEGVELSESELNYLGVFTEVSCDPNLKIDQFEEIFDDRLQALGMSEGQVDEALDELDKKGFIREAKGRRAEHFPHDLKLVAFEYIRRDHPGVFNKLFNFQLNVGGRGPHREAVHIDDVNWRQLSAKERFEMLIASHGKLGTLAIDKVVTSFSESGLSQTDTQYLIDACRQQGVLDHRTDPSGKYYDVVMWRVAFLKHRALQIGYHQGQY
jgi:hypothetical protein